MKEKKSVLFKMTVALEAEEGEVLRWALQDGIMMFHKLCGGGRMRLSVVVAASDSEEEMTTRHD